MNRRIALLVLALPCFMPLFARLAQTGFSEPAGLASDAALGLLVFVLALYLPRVLRIPLVLIWALFQAGSQELLATMQRLPSWQDLHYLADPTFVENSTQGFYLEAPIIVGLLMGSALVAAFFKLRRPPLRFFFVGILVFGLTLLAQTLLSHREGGAAIAARYNPLQWFIADAMQGPSEMESTDLPIESLPESLRSLDLSGQRLLAGKGRAKNVLIVAMEGMPGIYYPAIREAMGVHEGPFEMKGLAENTPDATLVPDFVTHSHQTIRGLYAMLCGDFSKFSYEMSKAIEVQTNSRRAGQCLPAQLAKNGWSTHYLQGAGLAFMNKDKVMPAIGFQQVHGSEWFKEADPYPFSWGKTDQVFFRGARDYIGDLEKTQKPWFMTLLTVGTHQPYAVPDDIAAKYPSRMIATSAILDQAISDFLKGLREDGVLDDTLVILTSDESHGDELADWVSSWGLMVIAAPEGKELPRIKGGSYGMLDVTPSVLDYFKIEPPPALIGRSFFRDYDTPRDMLSYTGSKLRWHTAGGERYECSRDGACSVGKAPSLLGFPSADFARDEGNHAQAFFAMAKTLDHKLTSHERVQVLKFGEGKVVDLPEKVSSEWGDNLAGAQYLSFPENSKIHVSIRVKALAAPPKGVQLKLTMRQFEILVAGVKAPPFPVLHAGEEGSVSFDIDNPEARQAFSFHLTGAGKGARIELEEFNVTITRG